MKYKGLQLGLDGTAKIAPTSIANRTEIDHLAQWPGIPRVSVEMTSLAMQVGEAEEDLQCCLELVGLARRRCQCARYIHDCMHSFIYIMHEQYSVSRGECE